MIKNKRDEFFEILSKAKHFKTSTWNSTKAFGFEMIEINDEVENSIVFDTLFQAVAIISEFAGKDKEEEIMEKILKFVSAEELVERPSFRLKIHLS